MCQYEACTKYRIANVCTWNSKIRTLQSGGWRWREGRGQWVRDHEFCKGGWALGYCGG